MPGRAEWLGINPSELRHSVQIQSQSLGRDAAGQQLDTWTTVLTARASIQAVKQDERYEEGQLTAQATHIIKLRWPPNVTVKSGMRVVCDSHMYVINNSPENVQLRNILLKLKVLELNGTT